MNFLDSFLHGLAFGVGVIIGIATGLLFVLSAAM